MTWQLRHQGSPRVIRDLSLDQIVDGLRDGVWEPTDEVLGPADKSWQSIESHPLLAEAAEEVETPPRPRHEEGTHLDMNALIDVCLVLLIFFILTTTYAVAVQKTVPITMTKEGKGKVRTIKMEDVTRNMIRVNAALEGGVIKIRVENLTGESIVIRSAITGESIVTLIPGAVAFRDINDGHEGNFLWAESAFDGRLIDANRAADGLDWRVFP